MNAHPQNMVRTFMRTFGQDAPTRQTLPSPETLQFRRDLIMEEADELASSQTKRDALDAIADLLYVVHGVAVACGFTPETVDAAFAEVHRSNMSKTWDEHDLDKMPNDAVAWRDAGSIVVRRMDGKVLKGPGYSPARLDQFIKEDA